MYITYANTVHTSYQGLLGTSSGLIQHSGPRINDLVHQVHLPVTRDCHASSVLPDHSANAEEGGRPVGLVLDRTMEIEATSCD